MSEEKSLTNQVAALTKPDAPGGMMSAQSARAVAEIQGSMTIAKRFPRDENDAYAKIMKACGRKSLAEVSIYEYPRGGQKISGPSIRLAEALAMSWGNLDTGVVELERKDGESVAMAYAVDLETNYKKTMIFTVAHTRDTKSGKTFLKEDRDIYERVANDGSRRLRNCILAVIPGDIVDAALVACEKAMNQDQIPLQDRIRAMMATMKEFGVEREQIETLFGCKAEALSQNQLARLRTIYNSLKDGIGSVVDFFKEPKVDAGAELTAKLSVKAEVKPVIASPIKAKADPDNFNEFDPNAK